MSKLRYVKSERLWLKKHPDLGEMWIGSRLIDNPSVLGIGGVIPKSVTPIIRKSGRIGLVFENKDKTRLYLVEIQIGKTGAEHIHDTEGIWREAKRGSNRVYIPVLAVETITPKYLQIVASIQLSSWAPFIVIEINTFRIGDIVTVNCLPVLDYSKTLKHRWLDKTTSQVLFGLKEREQKFGILYSPRQAERDFEEFYIKSKELQCSFAVMFIDIDHFKNINSLADEETIDETVLFQAQKLLFALVDPRGNAYRHGGDEFVLIMPNIDYTEAAAFAEKVRQKFEKYHFKIEKAKVDLTVSIGVALWPMDGISYKDVVKAASRAKKRAKKCRNKVELARQPDDITP